jgi:hypothetical protein
MLSPAHPHISKDYAQKSNGAAQEAAKLGREALGTVGDVSDINRAIQKIL